MSFKLDLHVHTQSFGRTFMTESYLRRYLKERQLDGLAATNFFNLSHAQWLQEKLPEFAIIVGQEVWSADGHIIGLGLKERVEDFQSAKETVAAIHEQGGIAIAVHPYLRFGVGDKVVDINVDAVEVYNAAVGPAWIYNARATRLAARHQLPGVASSDTTDLTHIGQSHTEALVDSKEDILNAIREGNVRLHKQSLPLPVGFIAKNILKYRNLDPCPLHASVCFVCEKSMSVRLLKETFHCIDCGVKIRSRIACCNGHYFCRACMFARIRKTDDVSRYENDTPFLEPKS